jgi:hypothetical protein
MIAAAEKMIAETIKHCLFEVDVSPSARSLLTSGHEAGGLAGGGGEGGFTPVQRDVHAIFNSPDALARSSGVSNEEVIDHEGMPCRVSYHGVPLESMPTSELSLVLLL